MGNGKSSAAAAKAPNASPLGKLAESPDPELAEAYTCDVLHTTKGILKGTWGHFEAVAFYRPLPGDAVRTVRHILIRALDIARYAEKEGETVEVDALGEGSYSQVFGMAGVAAKLISDRERPWVHKAAVENAIKADRIAVGPGYYGHGTVTQAMGGHFKGTVIFMERLDPRGDAWSETDTKALLGEAGKIARIGFHNDLKLDNVLRRGGQQKGRPVVIDFDLWAPWSLKVAVTSDCLEHNFQDFLEPLGEAATCSFREYCDLFALSLTLEDGRPYRSLLGRLRALWPLLEAPVLRPLMEALGEKQIGEVPFEVLIRVPLEGVTVNLLDLRGNLFVHLPHGCASSGTLPTSCNELPQLFRSNGVYWP